MFPIWGELHFVSYFFSATSALMLNVQLCLIDLTLYKSMTILQSQLDHQMAITFLPAY